MRGETADALRAVVAWRRANLQGIVFTPATGPARDALAAVDRALAGELTAGETAREAAIEQNHDLARLARGEPPVPVPELLDLSDLIDADAVARWLVAHEQTYTLSVGSWWRDQGTPPTAHLTGPDQFAHPGPRWDVVRERCARWVVATRLEARAHEQPTEAVGLRALARRALTTARLKKGWSEPALDPLEQELADVDAAWDAKTEPLPPDERPAPAKETAEHHGKRRRRAERRVLRRGPAIRRYVAKNAGCSGNDIVEHVPGSKADVLADVKAMVEADELTYDGQGYTVVEE